MTVDEIWAIAWYKGGTLTMQKSKCWQSWWRWGFFTREKKHYPVCWEYQLQLIWGLWYEVKLKGNPGEIFLSKGELQQAIVLQTLGRSFWLHRHTVSGVPRVLETLFAITSAVFTLYPSSYKRLLLTLLIWLYYQ